MNEADALILGAEPKRESKATAVGGADAYSGLIAEHARRSGVPEWLLQSVIRQESGFDPRAVNRESGAAGLGQLMPATAAALGVTDRLDPAESIRGAADYLAQGLAAGGGDIRRGLMYYYGGPDERQWGDRTRAYPQQVLRHAPEGQGSVAWPVAAKEPESDPVLAAMRAAATDGQAAQRKKENSADALILGMPASWNVAPDERPKPAPAAAANEPSSFVRGAKIALGQNMPSIYASLGLAGDLGERLFGEGGLSTGTKNFGLAGYAAGQEKLAPLSRENDDVTVALDKAKGGDLGALVDWGTYALGYTAGQVGTTGAMAILGALLGTAAAPGPGTVAGTIAGATGKGAVQLAAKTLFEKAVEKRAQQMVKGGIAEEVAKKAAVKSVAADIGAAAGVGATSLAQEAGQIYPAAVEQAQKEGRSLDGADMARVVGSTVAAAGVDWLTDMLGLGAVTGRIRVPGGTGGRAVAGVAGAGIGAGMEGATETGQTILERFGAGQPLTGTEAMRDYANAAALGMVGGGAVGVAAGSLGKPRSGDVIRADGQPFASPGDAEKAAEKNKYTSYSPIAVEGGWVLRAAPSADLETAASPGVPSPVTEAIDQIKREGTVRDATANVERLQRDMTAETQAAQPLPELFPAAAHEPIDALLARFAPNATPWERQQAAEAVRAAARRSEEAIGRIVPSTDAGLTTEPETEPSPIAGVPADIAARDAVFRGAEAEREALKRRDLDALQAESQVPRAEFDDALAARMGNLEPEQPTALALALRQALDRKAARDAAGKPARAPRAEISGQTQRPATAGAESRAAGSIPAGPPASTPSGPAVLQNRNRSSAASVAQMQSIAAGPDPSRLSFSRDFATGAPVVFSNADAAPQGSVLGREDTVATSSGRRLPVRYALVEADRLIPSHTADGTPSGNYRAGSPGSLRVVSGNARAAGLKKAFEIGTAGDYVSGIRADSALHWIPAEAFATMRRPVLVRVMRSADITRDIGAESNVSGTGTLSRSEMARTDASRVNFESLEFDDSGAPTQDAVRRFVMAMPASEQMGLLNPDGSPTRQAIDRLMAATFFAAYENGALVELYTQAIDPDGRAVLSALAASAGQMVRLRGAGPLDIRPIIVEAAQIAVNASRQGIALGRLAQQGDMVIAPDTAQVVQVFAENIRSWRNMAESLRRAAEFAYREANKPAEDMFGPTPRAARADVFGELNERRSTQGVEEPAGGWVAGSNVARTAPDAGPAPGAGPPAITGQQEANLQAAAKPRGVDRSGSAKKPLLSVPAAPGRGMTVARIEPLVRPVRERWRRLDIRVVQSATDLPFSVPLGTEGAYAGDGRIWIVADNIPSPSRLYEVLAHEAVGHAGMEETLGPGLFREAVNAVRGMERAGNVLVRELGAIVDARQPGLAPEARAKEIIALMAERGEPGKLPVWRRVVEAIRRFLRAIGLPLEWVNRQTEADVFRLLRAAERNLGAPRSFVAFRPEQIKSAIGNRGTFDPSTTNISLSMPPAPNGAALLSRLDATGQGSPFEHTATIAKSPAIADILASIVRATRKNDRSINPLVGAFMTQYGKAEHWARRGKTRFRDVFRETQAFLGDAARFAAAAETLAPSILHRLGGLAEWRGGAKAPDIRAIAAPLYEGTLYGGGSPFSGTRWSHAQLRERFGLTDRQITIYDEYLAAVDSSLDDFAKSVIYKHASNSGVAFRRGLSLADSAKEVSAALDRAAHEAGEKEAVRVQTLRSAANDVAVIAERTEALKRAGYVPLMRFGRHVVEAYERQPDGTERKVWRSHHDGAPLVPNSGQAEANRTADELRRKHPKWRVETSLLNQDQWRLYQRINPEALELFAGHLDAESDAAYQEWLRVATTNNSTMRRMIHREGMPGFSLDSRRTLAAFILSNARATSANYHMANMLRLAEEAGLDGGDIGSEAVKLVDYVRNPEEEAHRLRSFLFFNYIGGSLASAMVNMTQIPLMTLPHLSQYESLGRLAGRLASAAKEAVKDPGVLAGDVGEALRRAEADGITAPQELHQLAATASGNPLAGQYGVNAAMRLWGLPFAAAEVFNRRTTFIAAYQIGKSLSAEQLQAAGVDDAFAFAEQAVNETQGIYNKGSRPNVGRGAIGATLMTFKQFSIMWIELLARLPPKQQLLMLGLLVLAAGIEGLPFEEDAEDIIDTIGQWAGHATNSRRTLRGWAASAGEGIASLIYPDDEAKKAGETLAKLFLRGASSAGWMDVSARLGMQNLLPGTSLLKPSSSAREKVRDITEIGGPAASLVSSIGDALAALATGRPAAALETVVPVAVRNAWRGARTLATGEMRDERGRLLLPDATVGEGAGQLIGFNPQRRGAQSRAMADSAADRRLMATKRAEVVNQWVDGAITGDEEKIAKARDALRDWNTTNPDLRIVISQDTLKRQLAESRLTQRQRFIKALPKSLRREASENVPTE